MSISSGLFFQICISKLSLKDFFLDVFFRCLYLQVYFLEVYFFQMFIFPCLFLLMSVFHIMNGLMIIPSNYPLSLTCLYNRAEIVRDDVKGHHWIALLDEVFGHVTSHVPQPDETHGILPMCAAGDCKTEDQDLKFHGSTLFK